MQSCKNLAIFLILISTAQATEPRIQILAFKASWCGPCKKMEPVLQEIERKGYRVQRIDIDKYPKITKRFKIKVVPTTVILKDGKEVKRQTGFIPFIVLWKMLKLRSMPQGIASEARWPHCEVTGFI